MFGPLSDYYMY